MNRIIKILGLITLAIIFGILFTSSFTLAYLYRDFKLGLIYAFLGFIVMIFYFCLWFSEEITEKIKIRRYKR